MIDYLILSADASPHGRGVRGHTLTRFLRTYLGVRRVRQISPRRLRRAGDLQVDTVLVGMPSTIEQQDLEALRYRRLAVFDYHDFNSLAWNDDQQSWLRQRASIYLKPWRDEAWDHEICMGLLPIRRYRRFSYSLRWATQKDAWAGRRSRETMYDVAFVGLPNRTRIVENGRTKYLDQRVEWIHAIKSQLPQLRFWGGLVGVTAEQRFELEQRFGDAASLVCGDEKISFPNYFRALSSSKVLLTPGGNVPWTYRHYEALYCGGVVVSNDFRRRHMLVPFPTKGIVYVPDHSSVVPAVERALELREELPDLRQKNFQHLERFWRYGANSKRRPALLKRFVAQLEQPSSVERSARLAG